MSNTTCEHNGCEKRATVRDTFVSEDQSQFGPGSRRWCEAHGFEASHGPTGVTIWHAVDARTCRDPKACRRSMTMVQDWCGCVTWEPRCGEGAESNGMSNKRIAYSLAKAGAFA